MYVCAYSLETGSLPTVKIAKEGDKKVGRLEHVREEGEGGELGEVGRREREGRRREKEGS